MKKLKAYQRWFFAAGTILLCGGIHLLFDWFRYSSTLNSAPFSVWILVNCLAYGSASALCLAIGLILRRKGKKGKDDPQ